MPKDIKFVIVDRKPGLGLTEWLARRGIVGDVIPYPTQADVKGKIVFGRVSLHLASKALAVYEIFIPLNNKDVLEGLTADQMDAMSGKILVHRYCVGGTKFNTSEFNLDTIEANL